LLAAAADDADDADEAATTAAEGCEYSAWSEWSPCSKTCGNDGVQERQRRLQPVNGQLRAACGATLRLRRRMCSNLPPCDADRQTVRFQPVTTLENGRFRFNNRQQINADHEMR